MKKYIYFIRHGESLSNLNPLFSGSDDLLSDTGLKQAVLIAKRFKHIEVDAIYHSGILRAQKTAEKIEKITQAKPEIQYFLKERSGDFSVDGTYRYTEDFPQFLSRLTETKNFLENISPEHAVVVGHAIFLKALVSYLIIGSSLNEDLLAKFDSALAMNNAGISKCVFNEETRKWRVMSWNDLAHLAE